MPRLKNFSVLVLFGFLCPILLNAQNYSNTALDFDGVTHASIDNEGQVGYGHFDNTSADETATTHELFQGLYRSK